MALEFDLDIDIGGLQLDEDLKLKQQVTQVNERAVSEIVFNTGNVNLDTDLTRMFKQLDEKKQTMFESKGGLGEVKNLFVAILDRTLDLKDHKVLPAEAVMMMFEVGTTVHLDHTLLKDSKMSQEEMQMKAETRLLDQELQSNPADDMLMQLSEQLRQNNKTQPTKPLAQVEAAPKQATPAPKKPPSDPLFDDFKL